MTTGDPAAAEAGTPARRWTRRRVLAVGLGGTAAVVAAGATGLELVSHGVLPGKATLDELDGACSVALPPLAHGPLGPSVTSSFHSSARNRDVGYTIGYPPGHRPGDELPLVVMLHGWGGTHRDALVDAARRTALVAALPAGADTYLGKGCHTNLFFTEQEPPSLQFLARHLA